jgi:hypothetical protein
MMVNATSVVTQHRLDPNASHREAILYVALQLYHLFWRPSQSQVVKNVRPAVSDRLYRSQLA